MTQKRMVAPDPVMRAYVRGTVFIVDRKPGRHGEHWWHIIEGRQTIMSGFEHSERDARERAAGILQARGLHPVELQ